ncbi:hypothetical protein K1719_022824 [Acacia pycnantha]|nr:hypothetical protein K1719_022824 [Acacia pycnantha]
MYLGLFKGQNSSIDLSKSNSGLEPSTSHSCFKVANLSETRLDTKESSHLKDPYVLGEHLGVIVYILLSGMPPFWGKTKSRIFEAVKAADLRFPSEPWNHISKSAKDLIKGMLCTEPSQTLTAQQVLGANIVKSGSRTFAVYFISVTDVNNRRWTIKRRFRHFKELHQRLKEFPDYNLHLPPKHFLSTGLDVTVIQGRCTHLCIVLEEKLECFRMLKYDIEAERLPKPAQGLEKGYSRTRDHGK